MAPRSSRPPATADCSRSPRRPSRRTEGPAAGNPSLLVKRLEVEKGHDVLAAVELNVPVPLTVEGADRIFHPVAERASPAHESEAAIAFEVGGEQRPLRREQVPDVDAVPLVGERGLIAAEPELESVAEAVVDVAVEQVEWYRRSPGMRTRM